MKISMIAVVWVWHCVVYGQLPVNNFSPYSPYYDPYTSTFVVHPNAQLNNKVLGAQSGGAGLMGQRRPTNTKTFSFEDTITFKVNDLQGNIAELTAQLKGIHVLLAKKAEKSELDITNSAVAALTDSLKTTNANLLKKADQKDLDTTNSAVAALSESLKTIKTDVATKANQRDLTTTNTAVAGLIESLKTTNDNLGKKAEQKNLDTTNAAVAALNEYLKKTNDDLATKAEQSDLVTTNTAVKALTESLKTTNGNLELKAEQKNLDTTNAAVRALTESLKITDTNVAKKANQADLDTTNKAVAALDDSLKTTNTNVGKKANQADLETTNKAVAALDESLKTTNANVANKAEQKDLATTNTAVGSLTDSLKATNDNVATKANQGELDTTNKNVAALTDSLKTINADLAKKALQDDLLTTKKDVSDLKAITSPNSIGRIPTSCGDLKTIGFVKSGIYSIVVNKQVKNVYCDFTKSTDAELQKLIGTVDVQSTPIYFYAQLTSSFSNVNSAVSFSTPMKLNVGNAFTPSTGVFVAPTPGKYYFAFSGVNDKSGTVRVALQVMKTGTTTWSAEGEAFGSGPSAVFTLHATLDLLKGDQVRLLLQEGTIFENANRLTNYVGWLISENELPV